MGLLSGPFDFKLFFENFFAIMDALIFALPKGKRSKFLSNIFGSIAQLVQSIPLEGGRVRRLKYNKFFFKILGA